MTPAPTRFRELTIAESAMASKAIDHVERSLLAMAADERPQGLAEACAEWALIVATWPRFWRTLLERELRFRQALARSREPGRQHEAQLKFWETVFPPERRYVNQTSASAPAHPVDRSAARADPALALH